MLSNYAEAWREVALAKAERQRGQYIEAEARLRQCRAEFPAFGPAAAALADLVGGQGRHEEALAAWQAVIDDFSETMQPWWLHELAKAERASGQHIEAEAHLRQCREQFPAYGSAAATLADLMAGLGRHEEALAAWKAVINDFSESVQPWWLHELAKAERASGQPIEAEAHLRQCRAQFPAYGTAAATLADLMGEQGRYEEAIAAWKSVISDFSVAVQPWWLLELAKAERRCGRHVEAEAHLRQCRSRFPAYGPAAAVLADLAAARGRHEESVAVWKAAIEDFSATAQPWWFLGFAASWRALGRNDEAASVLDAMDARFPDLPDALVRRAETAMMKEDWAKALEIWNACIESHRDAIKPNWLNGQALALFRLWCAEEALRAWTCLNRQFPEFTSGRLSLAVAARELGRWSVVRQGYSELIDGNPDDARPEWFAERARALLYARSEQSAEQAIKELDVRFSDSAQGCNLALEYCYYMQFGVNIILPKIEASLRRFPHDRPLLTEYVRALLASGRQSNAAAVVADMEASVDDHYALISRWRLVVDRDGECALQEMARRAVRSRDWNLQSGLAIGNFLSSLLSVWAIELAQQIFDDLALKFPGRAAIVCARARTLIMLRQDESALQLIDSLPASFQTNEILELRAWAASRRGEHSQARDIWQAILAQAYSPALDGPEPNLRLLTPALALLPPGGVTAFAKIRNEMAHLPEFLRHHRKIGVGHFVFVDNMSTDDSAAYLGTQPDVTLYQTEDVFQTSSAGMRWINMLRERHGRHGWCLYADADELLIYPGWETTPLDRLIAYLESEGAEAVAAFMLDVYPEKLLDEAAKPAPREDYRYYDNDYAWIGQTKAPYLQPVGGVRLRLFQASEILHKTPLVRNSADKYINSHSTTPLRLSRISALLLHYKLFNLAIRFKPPEVSAGGNPFVASRSPEIMRRHVRYAARMANLLNARLVKPEVSETLTDSFVLADRGLMQAPAEFRHWLRSSIQER